MISGVPLWYVIFNMLFLQFDPGREEDGVWYGTTFPGVWNSCRRDHMRCHEMHRFLSVTGAMGPCD